MAAAALAGQRRTRAEGRDRRAAPPARARARRARVKSFSSSVFGSVGRKFQQPLPLHASAGRELKVETAATPPARARARGEKGEGEKFSACQWLRW